MCVQTLQKKSCIRETQTLSTDAMLSCDVKANERPSILTRSWMPQTETRTWRLTDQLVKIELLDVIFDQFTAHRLLATVETEPWHLYANT